MGKLEYLVVHCTYTPEGREVSRADIEQWHIKERGWSKVGYSDMLHLDGSLENLIDWNNDMVISGHEISNGARGYNSKSRHVVYVGGMDKDSRTAKDTRTIMQEQSLAVYVAYHLLRYPNIKVIGHNQISNKACPSFDVPQWMEDMGFDCKHVM